MALKFDHKMILFQNKEKYEDGKTYGFSDGKALKSSNLHFSSLDEFELINWQIKYQKNFDVYEIMILLF